MGKRIVFMNLALFVSVVLFANVNAENAAKIKRIEGKTSVLRKGAENWINARVNMPLNTGDAVYTRKESFVEIVYESGAILRMDEETKIRIEEVTSKGSKTKTPIGNIWANMQKLLSSRKDFELSSPTATAAIRGTVFNMNTKQDSSTDVSVYKGKVSVGPSKTPKKEDEKPAEPQDRYEVPGPEEIPGPYEVTLEEWRMIVSGQMISVNKDGKYSEQEFDMDEAAKDDFVKKNLELDKQLEELFKDK